MKKYTQIDGSLRSRIESLAESNSFSQTEYWDSNLIEYRRLKYQFAKQFLSAIKSRDDIDYFEGKYICASHKVLDLAGYSLGSLSSTDYDSSELIAYDIIAHNLLIKELTDPNGRQSQDYWENSKLKGIYVNPFSYLPVRTSWQDLKKWMWEAVFDLNKGVGPYEALNTSEIFELYQENYGKDSLISLPYNIHIINDEGVFIKVVENNSDKIRFPCVTYINEYSPNLPNLDRLRFSSGGFSLGMNKE